MDYLSRLESQSVYILREAYSRFEQVAMLWSLGKDSNVMIWLAKKAFHGHMPFPAVHVDTGKKFREMYEFRDVYARKWNLDLVVGDCPPVEEMDPGLPPAARSAARKTAGLKALNDEFGWTALFAGIRRDEQMVRAKERVFSPRNTAAEWNFRDQPPEFWGQYNTDFLPGTRVRVHPLLNWTEIDIWRYIGRENIPVIPLYFAREGKRYRSLGDEDITKPVDSDAETVDEIISELETTRDPERLGRVMDHEAEDSFERLRQNGYM